MGKNKFNVKEGSLAFWIKEEILDSWKGQTRHLVSLSSDEGSLVIIKNERDLLISIITVNTKEGIVLSYDLGQIQRQEKHMIAFVWSQKENIVKLFFDGIAVSSKHYFSSKV